MARILTISEWIEGYRDWPLLDVRTPAEYAQGHIPGAINFPLFSNEERAEVGTIYKQVGPEEALLRGLEFVGPRMADMVRQARQLAPEGRVVVHCWRGGQRSGSVAWLLEKAGFETCTLQGGYKAWRNFILDGFHQLKRRIVLLGGRTGSGKTAILHELARLGEQVIDLEGLAHHKGSAFGALGEQPQPTTEQFENELFVHWWRLDPERRVWLESESRSIGRVFIPEGVWEQMRQAPYVRIHVPFERRVERLVADYGRYEPEALIASFHKIRKRLGGQWVQAAEEAIREGRLGDAAAIALRYYDKTYDHFVEKHQPPVLINLEVPSGKPEDAARMLHALEVEGTVGT